jgi:peptide/nickel transport system permease protein
MSMHDRKLKKRFLGSPTALVASGMLMVMVFLVMAAPLITSYDPLDVDLKDRLSLPGQEHLLGTDELGRDLFARVLYGGQNTLLIALTVAFMAFAIGTTMGLLSGYYGGVLDMTLMRFVDIMLAFPHIILALVIAGLMGPGLENLILALTLTHWPAYVRMARSGTLQVKEMAFVEAARSMRFSNLWIIRRHVLPNVSDSLMVMLAMDLANVIIIASALSFLGLGIQPPTPEWGSMLRAGVPYLTTAPLLTFVPGAFIFLTVVSINLLGDWLRDVLDPHSHEIEAVVA